MSGFLQKVKRKLSGSFTDASELRQERSPHDHRDHQRESSDDDRATTGDRDRNGHEDFEFREQQRSENHAAHGSNRDSRSRDRDRGRDEREYARHSQQKDDSKRPGQSRDEDTASSYELSRSYNEMSLRPDSSQRVKRHATASTTSESNRADDDERSKRNGSEDRDDTGDKRREKNGKRIDDDERSKRDGSEDRGDTGDKRREKRGKRIDKDSTRKSSDKRSESSVSPRPRSMRSRTKSFDDGSSKTRRRRKSTHPNAIDEKQTKGDRRKSIAQRKRSVQVSIPDPVKRKVRVWDCPQKVDSDSDGPEPGTCGRRHTRVIKNTVTQQKLFRTLAHDHLRLFGWTTDMAGTLHSVAKMFNGYTGWVEFAPTSNMKQACERLHTQTINEDAVDKTKLKGDPTPPENGYLYAFCGTRSERCTAPEGNDMCARGQGDWVDQFAIGWLLKKKALSSLHKSM